MAAVQPEPWLRALITNKAKWKVKIMEGVSIPCDFVYCYEMFVFAG
jgi:hypothetical protein